MAIESEVSITPPDEWNDEYENNGYIMGKMARGKSLVQVSLEPNDGCVMKWFHFIDLFRMLVHETDISPGEKLAVLLRSLKEEALSTDSVEEKKSTRKRLSD